MEKRILIITQTFSLMELQKQKQQRRVLSPDFAEDHPLPGRLSECKLSDVTIEHVSYETRVIYHFELGIEGFIVQYIIETRLWDIDLDNARFNGVHHDLSDRDGIVKDYDPLFVLAKLLLNKKAKKARHIAALKRWRRLLFIFPGDSKPVQNLLTLNT
jgi:hypothetical protein